MFLYLRTLSLIGFLLLLRQGYAQTDTLSRFRPVASDDYSIFLENKELPRPPLNEPTYSITITVTGIRNDDGVIRFKFYDDRTPFPHDKGFLRIVVPKTLVKNGSFTVTYHGFTAGMMGIALQDDENNNQILDFGWFLPKEGHAFSDYHHTAARRPTYSDFRFMLTGNKSVVMKMKYY